MYELFFKLKGSQAYLRSLTCPILTQIRSLPSFNKLKFWFSVATTFKEPEVTPLQLLWFSGYQILEPKAQLQ